jgi:hypothetical protein
MSITQESVEKATIGQSQPGRPTALDWYLANFDRLVEEYPGEWLAIVGQEVIAHAPSTAALRKELDARGVSGVFLGLAHPDALAPLCVPG